MNIDKIANIILIITIGILLYLSYRVGYETATKTPVNETNGSHIEITLPENLREPFVLDIPDTTTERHLSLTVYGAGKLTWEGK